MKAEDASPLVPPLRELGDDLLCTTPLRRAATLALPFLCTAAYFVCAARGWWPLAGGMSVSYRLAASRWLKQVS